jgi:hypothetical protein
LESWRRRQVVSDAEYEGIRKRYDRLLEREDAWIMEARRLALPQGSLYLGAWILAVGMPGPYELRFKDNIDETDRTDPRLSWSVPLRRSVTA